LPEPSTELLTEGLARLKGSLDGLALVAGKNHAGAFPNTALGKQAAKHCQERGLVRPLRRALSGRVPIELFALSVGGDAWLTEHAAPRLALQHLAAALAQRSEQIGAFIDECRAQTEQLGSLRCWIEGLLSEQRENESRREPLPGEAEILSALEEWRARHPLKDCALPELYRQIEIPGLSVGRFHDACRKLLERGRIYVHPWTGPLYEMPEPGLAFLTGHEIGYYASLREAGRNGSAPEAGCGLLMARSEC
jgi:hypothetical protein